MSRSMSGLVNELLDKHFATHIEDKDFPQLKDLGKEVTIDKELELVPSKRPTTDAEATRMSRDVCKEHGIPKSDCKLMKHKGEKK